MRQEREAQRALTALLALLHEDRQGRILVRHAWTEGTWAACLVYEHAWQPELGLLGRLLTLPVRVGPADPVSAAAVWAAAVLEPPSVVAERLRRDEQSGISWLGVPPGILFPVPPA